MYGHSRAQFRTGIQPPRNRHRVLTIGNPLEDSGSADSVSKLLTSDQLRMRAAYQSWKYADLSNAEIAKVLLSLAQLLSVQKENPFKIKAYRRAAKAIPIWPTASKNSSRQRRI